ncbi:MAG: helix-turn-helix domain-containing protein, partial [Candidatus Thorarchaeota archaeon]
VWVHKGDLYFIALVSQHDSAEIYRVVLQDLASKFVSQYYSELVKDNVSPKMFSQFVDTVELTLHKFSGIPGLARRYKTAVLPSNDLMALKEILNQVEENPPIYRGALVTTDCFIVVSNMRAYEMEDVLDIAESLYLKGDEAEEMEAVTHPGLERNTSFFFLRVPKKGICAFVVRPGETDSVLYDMVKDFVELVKSMDLEIVKKAYPSRQESPMAFYSFDVVALNRSASEILAGLRPLFSDLPTSIQKRIRAVIACIGKNTTISDIHEESGISRAQVDEALAHLIAQGAIRILRLYPSLGKKDERFAAYLEVVGIPKRDYKVLDAIWSHCNGRLSLRDISKETGIPVPRIYDVLRSLGSQVSWIRKLGGEP